MSFRIPAKEVVLPVPQQTPRDVHDPLIRFLNFRGYIPILVPRGSLVPPTVYILEGDRYVLVRCLNEMLSDEIAVRLQSLVVPAQELERRMACKHNGVLSVGFFRKILSTFGIGGDPEIEAVLSRGADARIAFEGVELRSVEPRLVLEAIKSLPPAQFGLAVLESGKLHIAYEYLYARSISIGTGDYVEGALDACVELGPVGQVSASIEGNRRRAELTSHNGGEPVAFASKVGKLRWVDGAYDFEWHAKRGYGLVAAQTPRPYLSRTGQVYEIFSERMQRPQEAGTEDSAWMGEIAPMARDLSKKPLYWNTCLLDGERLITDQLVTVGREYRLEMWLDHVAEGLTSTEIARDAVEDGLEITFVVSSPLPVVRPSNTPERRGEFGTWAEVTAVYQSDAGRSEPRAKFDLHPSAPGPTVLVLSVYTRNVIRSSNRITLVALRHAEAIFPSAVPAVSVRATAPDILTAPRAELRLELTPAGEIVLGTGVKSERPRRPARDFSQVIAEAIRARMELVKLSNAYRPAGPLPFGVKDGPAQCFAMAQIGARMHDAFFGRPEDPSVDADTKRLAKSIAETEPGARLHIGAAYQPFPWAVFYDGAYRGRPLTRDPASVDLRCFWGHRLRIDRAILGHVDAPRAPVMRHEVRVQACLNPWLDDEQGAFGVKVIAEERALFVSGKKGTAALIVYPIIDKPEEFLAYLQTQEASPCDLFYVFCHATAAVTRDALFTYQTAAPDTQAKLVFDRLPGTPIDVAMMRDMRPRPLVDRPLVFLNACSTSAGDEAFQGQFLEQFIERWQAVGVIGTDWEVPTVFAHEFATALFDYFLNRGKSLGDAFAAAGADAFQAGNPFPLVYALYAPPELTIARIEGGAS